MRGREGNKDAQDVERSNIFAQFFMDSRFIAQNCVLIWEINERGHKFPRAAACLMHDRSS